MLFTLRKYELLHYSHLINIRLNIVDYHLVFFAFFFPYLNGFDRLWYNIIKKNSRDAAKSCVICDKQMFKGLIL